MPWYAIALSILGSYLLGSIPFALLLGLSRGVDIRRIGSGNPGATNLGRALGKRWAIGAFLLDFSKGLLPVLVLLGLEERFGGDAAARYLTIAAGAAAIAGHVFPVWLRFRGGKGVATAFGVMAGLIPVAAAAAGGAWLLAYRWARTVSIASIVAAFVFPIAAWLSHFGAEPTIRLERTILAAAVTVLIIVRHASNIARLLRGEESRFGDGAKRRGDDDRGGDDPSPGGTGTAEGPPAETSERDEGRRRR